MIDPWSLVGGYVVVSREGWVLSIWPVEGPLVPWIQFRSLCFWLGADGDRDAG